MLPDQRGLISSWLSSERGGKRRQVFSKSARNHGGRHRRSRVEHLEPRHLLTANLYVDFGNLLSSVLPTAAKCDKHHRRMGHAWSIGPKRPTGVGIWTRI